MSSGHLYILGPRCAFWVIILEFLGSPAVCLPVKESRSNRPSSTPIIFSWDSSESSKSKQTKPRSFFLHSFLLLSPPFSVFLSSLFVGKRSTDADLMLVGYVCQKITRILRRMNRASCCVWSQIELSLNDSFL